METRWRLMETLVFFVSRSFWLFKSPQGLGYWCCWLGSPVAKVGGKFGFFAFFYRSLKRPIHLKKPAKVMVQGRKSLILTPWGHDARPQSWLIQPRHSQLRNYAFIALIQKLYKSHKHKTPGIHFPKFPTFFVYFLKNSVTCNFFLGQKNETKTNSCLNSPYHLQHLLPRFAKSMGTSSALGSVVRAWDVRDVSDQVRIRDCEKREAFGKLRFQLTQVFGTPFGGTKRGKNILVLLVFFFNIFFIF